jgi:hypothetical protein
MTALHKYLIYGIMTYTMTKRLTLKQEKFVEGILEGKTATQSVIEAGYNPSNALVASSIGSENLSKPIIQERIDTIRKEIRDSISQKLKDNNSLSLAIDSAMDDLCSPDAKARDYARRFLLDCSKYIDNESTSKIVDSKHLHLHIPKRE